MADSSIKRSREVPDRRIGGMSEAEKGKGKLHLLHEGEIVLNRAVTGRLLNILGLSKDTAMKMSGPSLMKRVKTVLDQAKREVDKVKEPSAEGAVPKRESGGMARAARKAPKRQAGGMAAPARARAAPSRAKGGMAAPGTSAARAERAHRLGQYADRDTL